MALRIEGGHVLLPEGLATIDLLLDHGRIDAIGRTRPARTFDARGLHVLPGIFDLHGDAFERQMQPRPGVPFPASLAFRETERQLLANGVSTAFHAVTLGWEPGLRGTDAWRTPSTCWSPAPGPATCASTCDGNSTTSTPCPWRWRTSQPAASAW